MGIPLEDMLLLHVPPNNTSEVMSYVGPFAPGQVHVNQPVSTMLMDPRLPLAEYFEAKKTTLQPIIETSVFVVLNRRKLAHNPQQLLLARYRQTLEDEDDNIVDDVKLTKESVDQVQKMILQMQKETATLFYKQKILLEGPDKTNHHATVIQTSWRRLALMRRWRALRRQAKATPDKWDAAHQVAFMHGHKGKFRKMQAP